MIIFFPLFSISATNLSEPNQALFRYLSYKGNDERFRRTINESTEFYNPLFIGFYPDPSICRKGNDYYLVHSSFVYYPAIPIFHSKDLVSWTQVGFAVTSLNIENSRISGGIYAPTIRYNPHNDLFYVIVTNVDHTGNFFVTAKDPSSTWSSPKQLSFSGIDPSFLFDDNGKSYVSWNNEPPETLYEGHRAIYIQEFDDVNGEMVGDSWLAVNGGVNISENPIWIEGPHLYKVNGRYMLMCAEGGTGTWHSEVAFFSETIDGPFVPYEGRLLSQRNFPNPRPDIVTSTGHADLVEDVEGNWWAVFLGVRPYKGDNFNTGRETFLLPVEWVKGVPIILEEKRRVQAVVKKNGAKNIYSGNFEKFYEFNDTKLGYDWLTLRNQIGDWLHNEKKGLLLDSVPRSIYQVTNPAFVSRRVSHLEYFVETEVQFSPRNETEIAGLALYQNELYNFVVGKTLVEGKSTIVLFETRDTTQIRGTISIDDDLVDNPVKIRAYGKIENISFEVSFDGGEQWISIGEDVDATTLSTDVAGGFTGAVVGPYTSATHVPI